jgi:hypothetical protein
VGGGAAALATGQWNQIARRRASAAAAGFSMAFSFSVSLSTEELRAKATPVNSSSAYLTCIKFTLRKFQKKIIEKILSAFPRQANRFHV